MSRLQKKCLAFSVGLHGLLLAVLIAGSAFAPAPKDNDLVLLNMIPANILDKAGVGGGSPQAVALQPAPPPPQPQAQAQPTPLPPPPKPERQERRTEIPKPVEPKRRVEPKEITRAEPEPAPAEHGLAPEPKPRRKPHEVQVDYTPASTQFNKSKKQKETDEARQAAIEADQARAAARASARAEARRQREIKAALDTLASGVAATAAQHVTIDNEGEGGPSFADYKTVIYSIYNRNWIRPDSTVNRGAQAKVRILVGRDGSIISAEIVTPSGEASMDRSVERDLRSVKSLPPFPAGAQDQQRSFFILFDLSTEAAG